MVEAKYMSREELRSHNKEGDMWLSIQGKIYDVTNWAKKHPGGEVPLLRLAGEDVTDAFQAYHPTTATYKLRQLFTGYQLLDYSASPISTDYRNLLANLTNMGLFNSKGKTLSLTLITIAVLMPTVMYGTIFLQGTLTHLLCALLMGFVWIQSGWLGHDSGHYQVTTTPEFNRLIQLLTGNCLAGISIAWWKLNHNAHHIACNSLHYDPDLQHMPFFAVSHKFFQSLTSHFYNRTMKFDSLSRFLVSYQHFTFYPVMCLARLNLFAQSFLLLLSSKPVPKRSQEILCIISFWIWFPALLSFLPNWKERAMFVAASFSVTGIQHVQFCLNHFSSAVYTGYPSGNDWFEKQTSGTLDISCPRWMDWFHGGLQFQVEHHLFPRLPRGQLRKVSPFVKGLCEKHGIPYKCVSFWEANLLTVETLRAAALQARDVSNPVPKYMVWEALNTHG